MLYLGKWTSKKNKEFVPSFTYTAARLNRLYGMAKEDNPYAEAALIDIDFHFDEMQELIKKIKVVARNCIKNSEKKGIKTTLLYKKEPYIKKYRS